MSLSMNQAIQRKLDRLAGIDAVQAAVLVMHPAPSADEFRFLAASADASIWSLIAPLSHRFRANGASALQNESVTCSGTRLQLLASHYGDASRSPYLIAVTLPLGEAYDVSAMRNELEKIVRDCIAEADSIQWK